MLKKHIVSNLNVQQTNTYKISDIYMITVVKCSLSWQSLSDKVCQERLA